MFKLGHVIAPLRPTDGSGLCSCLSALPAMAVLNQVVVPSCMKHVLVFCL
jgi:hypothetical protein